MGIVVVIDGREAIPVRAIPFVAGWMLSPDAVAMTFAKTDHWVTRLDGVVAYYLSVSGKYSPMLAKEWDGIEADLKILTDKLKATEAFEQENYPVWRQQSILRLPASCFVWRDEFEEAFRHSYSTERYTLLDERPGDRELNFSPRIPEELALAVMQGFSAIQPDNGSNSSVENPLSQKKREALRKPNDDMDVSTPAFESMETALEGWFDKPLTELTDALRHRVETDFSPIPWDNVSPGQRRYRAKEWDCQHDPAMESERQYWWNFYIRMDKLKEQIETWTTIATPTATDLAQKETRLAELQRELAKMKEEEKQPYIKPDVAHNSGSDEANRSDLVEPLNMPLNDMPKNESIVKKARIDGISIEIEEAIRELGKKGTTQEIMQKLKSYAQKDGSCITEAGTDFVLWRNGSGEPSKLDIKLLRKRLERRTKKIKIPRLDPR